MSVRVVDSRRSSHYTNEGERLVRCGGGRRYINSWWQGGAGGRGTGTPTSGVRPAGSAVIERAAQRCSRLLATHVHWPFCLSFFFCKHYSLGRARRKQSTYGFRMYCLSICGRMTCSKLVLKIESRVTKEGFEVLKNIIYDFSGAIKPLFLQSLLFRPIVLPKYENKCLVNRNYYLLINDRFERTLYIGRY